jgi:DNA-binding transcriptional ArsR family regulator
MVRMLIAGTRGMLPPCASSLAVLYLPHVPLLSYVLDATHDEWAKVHMNGVSKGRGPAQVPLPEDVPVEMPALPLTLAVTTPEQFKAFGDPVRVKILGIIQQRPATAKQIADILGIAPGTAGHHLQVLEAAGLAQVVARRIVRGIVAKYYTRTARIFTFDFGDDLSLAATPVGDILAHAHDEHVESVAAYGKDAVLTCGYPRVRLSADKAKAYQERLDALIEEFLAEEPDPEGQVYGLVEALFLAPPYLQPKVQAGAAEQEGRDDERSGTA